MLSILADVILITTLQRREDRPAGPRREQPNIEEERRRRWVGISGLLM
jgi:hypothetical protein